MSATDCKRFLAKFRDDQSDTPATAFRQQLPAAGGRMDQSKASLPQSYRPPPMTPRSLRWSDSLKQLPKSHRQAG
jgi:hypothetical protein